MWWIMPKSQSVHPWFVQFTRQHSTHAVVCVVRLAGLLRVGRVRPMKGGSHRGATSHVPTRKSHTHAWRMM